MNAINNIKYLLSPKTIAILGCSETNPGGATLKNLLNLGYKGEIYPVHPKKEEVMGIKCYKSLEDIGKEVDCCVVSLRASLIPQTIEDMKKCGAKAAVVFASGFSETGDEGRRLQAEVSKQIEEAGIAVCGANCLGLINLTDNIPLYSAPIDAENENGPIGMVAHSGSACIAMMSAARGTGYSYLISCGNEAGLGVQDYFEYMLEDDSTKILAGYLEAVRSPEKLARVADMAVQKGKPIVVFKTGRSEIGQKTASAHSGALASPTAIVDAYFKKNNILTAKSFDELAEACELLSKLKDWDLETDKIACTAISGGQLGFTSDVASEEAVEFGQIGEEAKAKIRAVLPDFATANNPLDVTTALFDPPAYKECIRAMAGDPSIGLILICQDAEAGMAVDESKLYCSIAQAIVEVHQEISKPIAVFSPISAGFDKPFAKILRDGNIPLLQGAHESLHAVKLLIDWDKIKKNYGKKAEITEQKKLDFNGSRVLSERQSKAQFEKFGLSVAKDILVQTKDEAVKAADEIGYPVIIKVDSPDILHKTEAGIVKLNIKNEAELTEAYDAVIANTKSYNADARISGVSVQEMVESGVEMLIGAKNDPSFGPSVMVGLGGIFVEVFKDFSLSLAPVNRAEALEMINSLKGSKLLYGARGAKEADTEALADFIVKFSQMVAANRDTFAEIDINPVIVLEKGKGVKAVDGLIISK